MNHSLSRAIDILFFVAQQGQYPTLSLISRELGIPKSTAFSLVHTMVDRGILQVQDPKRLAVGLGPSLFDLGQTYLNRHGMPHLLHQELSALTEAIHRSVSLIQFSDGSATLVEMIPYRASVYPNVPIGQSSSLERDPLGPLYLAAAQEELLQHQPRLTAMRAQWADTITAIRAHGFHIARVNRSDDLYALCVPIMVGVGRCFGALCAYGTEFDPAGAEFAVLLSSLQEAAVSLSNKSAFMK